MGTLTKAGALVTASQASALATIQQLDPVYVDVTQSSAELLRLKQNLASGLAIGVAIGIALGPVFEAKKKPNKDTAEPGPKPQ